MQSATCPGGAAVWLTEKGIPGAKAPYQFIASEMRKLPAMLTLVTGLPRRVAMREPSELGTCDNWQSNFDDGTVLWTGLPAAWLILLVVHEQKCTS